MHKGPVVSILAWGAIVFAASTAHAQPEAEAPADPAGADEPAAPPDEDAAPPAEDAAPEEPSPEEEPGATEATEPEPETAPAPVQPSQVRPAPAPVAPPAAPGSLSPLSDWPKPEEDEARLRRQGREEAATDASDVSGRVFAEDWWSHSRPILELHGYFRVRAELFHRISLSRINAPEDQLFPRPLDNHYTNTEGSYGPVLCTRDEAGLGKDDNPNRLVRCRNRSMAGANMRFRLNPELHISDNLRVMTQIDMLDNLVLGSTPQGYALSPDAEGGYATVQRGGYTPVGAMDGTQEPPASGVNGFKDSIRVKRAWAEYVTPVGELRFGRMPSHWGLGILLNSGDGYDDDYQTTMDRIMFVTGIQSLDLFFAGAWDFPNEGATSEDVRNAQGQPYDAAQLDDVDQWALVVARKKGPHLTRLALAQGNLVVNGGVYFIYRKQLLANDAAGSSVDGAYVPGAYPGALTGENREGTGSGYVRRGAHIWIPDLWLQLLYKKFRFELEAVTVQGSIENTASTGSNYADYDGWKLRQYGLATELEQKLVEDKLSLQFKFGWASGDAEASETNLPGGGGLVPGLGGGMQGQFGDDTYSTFAFHPNYKVDLILNRNILSRVQGAYYFRPSLDYDFMRNPNGQRLGGGFAGIWTRASQFMQTPGHRRDLGVELDAQLYFQSKDGVLNDDLDSMGGFYTMLQYGVLFPLGGLGYQSAEGNRIADQLNSSATETKPAQVLRWYLGVLF